MIQGIWNTVSPWNFHPALTKKKSNFYIKKIKVPWIHSWSGAEFHCPTCFSPLCPDQYIMPYPGRCHSCPHLPTFLAAQHCFKTGCWSSCEVLCIQPILKEGSDPFPAGSSSRRATRIRIAVMPTLARSLGRSVAGRREAASHTLHPPLQGKEGGTMARRYSWWYESDRRQPALVCHLLQHLKLPLSFAGFLMQWNSIVWEWWPQIQRSSLYVSLHKDFVPALFQDLFMAH